MGRNCTRLLRILFEWLEFAFECFQSLAKGSNLYSTLSNPFPMVRICIQMHFQMVRIFIPILPISFECLELAVECFESLSIGKICIRMLGIAFESLEFAFQCFKFYLEWFDVAFECLEFLLILDSNASNLVRRVRICIRML